MFPVYSANKIEKNKRDEARSSSVALHHPLHTHVVERQLGDGGGVISIAFNAIWEMPLHGLNRNT